MTTTATATMPRGDTNEAVLCSCLANLIRYHEAGHRAYEMRRQSKEWQTLGNVFRYAVQQGYAEFHHPSNGSSLSVTPGVVRVAITEAGRAWLRAQRWEGGTA